MNGSFTLIWLYFLFPQYGNKDCTEGYSSYRIIESVDSICRDSVDTQYMLIQANFSNLQNS